MCVGEGWLIVWFLFMWLVALFCFVHKNPLEVVLDNLVNKVFVVNCILRVPDQSGISRQ